MSRVCDRCPVSRHRADMMHLGPGVDTVGRPLDQRQCDSAWKFYQTNVTAMNCSRILKNAVLNTGVTQLSDADDHFLVRHMDTFARNCVDWLMCVGVVPVVVKGFEGGRRLPVVPQPHRVQLSVRDLPGGDVGYRGVLDASMNLFGLDDTNDILVWGGGDACDCCAPDTTTCRRYPPRRRRAAAYPDLRTRGAGRRERATSHRAQDSQGILQFWMKRAHVAVQLGTNPVLVTQNRAHVNRDTDGVVWNVDEDTALAAEQARIDRIEVKSP